MILLGDTAWCCRSFAEQDARLEQIRALSVQLLQTASEAGATEAAAAMQITIEEALNRLE